VTVAKYRGFTRVITRSRKLVIAAAEGINVNKQRMIIAALICLTRCGPYLPHYRVANQR
jgi:hypothetical protein